MGMPQIVGPLPGPNATRIIDFLIALFLQPRVQSPRFVLANHSNIEVTHDLA